MWSMILMYILCYVKNGTYVHTMLCEEWGLCTYYAM